MFGSATPTGEGIFLGHQGEVGIPEQLSATRGGRRGTRRHSTGCSIDGPVGDRLNELSVVSLVLVRIQAGELAH